MVTMHTRGILLLLFWSFWSLRSVSAGIENFFREVKTSPVNLVILMDRSTAIGRYHFYTKEKPLIHDVIKYHLPVNPDKLRIAIATFAVDVDVIVDGISQANPITKCDIFKNGGFWEKVLYKVQYVSNGSDFRLNNSLTDGTFVDKAFDKANSILQSAAAGNRPSVNNIVLIITDAAYEIMDPRAARDRLLQSAQIYVIGTGPWLGGRLGNLYSLQTEGNRDKVQVYTTWRHVMENQPMLINAVSGPEWVNNTFDPVCHMDRLHCETVTGLSICHQYEYSQNIVSCPSTRCSNGGRCRENRSNGLSVCVCPAGYKGRFCEINENECLSPGVCNLNFDCQDRVNGYECLCEGKCKDTYCDCTEMVSRKENTDSGGRSTNWWIYALPVTLYVFIVLVATVCAFERIRNEKKVGRFPNVAESSTVTSSSRESKMKTMTSGVQTYDVAPGQHNVMTSQTAGQRDVTSDSRPASNYTYDVPRGESSSDGSLSIAEKLRTLISTSAVPQMIRHNTRRISRLIRHPRPAPQSPPSAAQINNQAQHNNTAFVDIESPENTRELHNTGNNRNTIDLNNLLSSERQPRMVPLLPPVKPKNTAGPATLPKPVTLPTPPTVPLKPVQPVRPYNTHKPRVAPKPQSSYGNQGNAIHSRLNERSTAAYFENSDGNDGISSDDASDYLEVDDDTLTWNSFDSSIAEPVAPTERPDIILENFQRRAQPIGSEYSSAPQNQDMGGWLNFICNLTSEEGQNLDRASIIQIDGKRWISSDGSLRLGNITDIGAIYRTLHTKAPEGTEVVVGMATKRVFYVEKNDGMVLQAVGGKMGRRDEILCIAKSRKFIIMGGIALNKDWGQCALEIDFIRAHLKNMGD